MKETIKCSIQSVQSRISMIEQEELAEELDFNSLSNLEHQIDLMQEALDTAKKWVLSAYDELDG
jgi:hypothetical protein